MANRFELAYQAWPILTRAAKERRTLTYQDLAAALGYKGAKVAKFPLWSIQDFCLEKGLPPLTSIVINKRTRRPGSGFIAWEGDIGDAHQRVFEKDWSVIPIPFPPGTLLTRKTTVNKAVKTSITSYEVPDSATVVNGRGPYQGQFRGQLMRLYSRQCALCDTRHSALLVASHIVPWSLDSKNRLNPQNGILLCLTHDAAFDKGILHIWPDFTVSLIETEADKLGADLAQFITRHTEAKLRIPRGGNAPNPKLLAWRLSKNKASLSHLSN